MSYPTSLFFLSLLCIFLLTLGNSKNVFVSSNFHVTHNVFAHNISAHNIEIKRHKYIFHPLFFPENIYFWTDMLTET